MKLKITEMGGDFRVDVTDDNDNPLYDKKTGESGGCFSYDLPVFIKWHGYIYAITVIGPYCRPIDDLAMARALTKCYRTFTNQERRKDNGIR
jgi:hypothetical protein